MSKESMTKKAMVEYRLKEIESMLMHVETDMIEYYDNESEGEREDIKNSVNSIRDELATLRAYAKQIG